MSLRKYIPTDVYKSVYDIDFLTIYQDNIRLIFLDIDNTLAPYDEDVPSKEAHELIQNLQTIGFEIILISNNNKKRVSRFSNPLKIPYVHFALKPLKRGFKRGLKYSSKLYNPQQVLVIGDQLMTDIVGGNKMGFNTVLVAPLKKKSDIFTTRFNRRREQRVLRKLKKHHQAAYDNIHKIL